MLVKSYWCHVFFFFSSRRRHTRFDCDWSSDVCSSDLTGDWKLGVGAPSDRHWAACVYAGAYLALDRRSEEHTSELQSQSNLVCRLLLEKKTNNTLFQTRYASPGIR